MFRAVATVNSPILPSALLPSMSEDLYLVDAFARCGQLHSTYGRNPRSHCVMNCAKSGCVTGCATLLGWWALDAFLSWWDLFFQFISSVICSMMEQYSYPNCDISWAHVFCDVPTTSCAVTKFPMATRRHGLRDFEAFWTYITSTYHIIQFKS